MPMACAPQSGAGGVPTQERGNEWNHRLTIHQQHPSAVSHRVPICIHTSGWATRCSHEASRWPSAAERRARNEWKRWERGCPTRMCRGRTLPLFSAFLRQRLRPYVQGMDDLRTQVVYQIACG